MPPANTSIGSRSGWAPAGELSNRRLAALLALTALPVVLTTAVLSVPGVMAAARRHLEMPYLSFAIYAVANWLTFGIVVRVAGWRRLRAQGLQFPAAMSRIVAAGVAFLAGLAVFLAVSTLLARAGLPPVRGMEFRDASAVDIAILFVSAVVAAPFCEEVFFRVLWIGALRARMSVTAASIVSILAFAAIHLPYFGVGGVIFITVWSILPTALFVRFGDLTAPLSMHVMNNAFAYLLVPFVLTAAS
jgi:membrane protease YdiL (CAAX protease family)